MGEGLVVLSVTSESAPPCSPSRRPSQSRMSVLHPCRIGRAAVRIVSVSHRSGRGSIVVGTREVVGPCTLALTLLLKKLGLQALGDSSADMIRLSETAASRLPHSVDRVDQNGRDCMSGAACVR